MANTITTKVIINNVKRVILKIDILGDGSGEEVKKIIFDASLYDPLITKIKLDRIKSTLSGFSAKLYFDGDVDEPLLTLIDGDTQQQDFQWFGGLNNNAATNRTGDILISTDGLASIVGATGTIILNLVKRGL